VQHFSLQTTVGSHKRTCSKYFLSEYKYEYKYLVNVSSVNSIHSIVNTVSNRSSNRLENGQLISAGRALDYNILNMFISQHMKNYTCSWSHYTLLCNFALHSKQVGLSNHLIAALLILTFPFRYRAFTSVIITIFSQFIRVPSTTWLNKGIVDPFEYAYFSQMIPQSVKNCNFITCYVRISASSEACKTWRIYC